MGTVGGWWSCVADGALNARGNMEACKFWCCGKWSVARGHTTHPRLMYRAGLAVEDGCTSVPLDAECVFHSCRGAARPPVRPSKGSITGDLDLGMSLGCMGVLSVTLCLIRLAYTGGIHVIVVCPAGGTCQQASS